MKKLEAVIFDMDGVLFDTERMSCECCFEAAKQLGLTLAEEAVYGGCGRNEASQTYYGDGGALVSEWNLSL